MPAGWPNCGREWNTHQRIVNTRGPEQMRIAYTHPNARFMVRCASERCWRLLCWVLCFWARCVVYYLKLGFGPTWYGLSRNISAHLCV